MDQVFVVLQGKVVFSGKFSLGQKKGLALLTWLTFLKN